jgi:adenosylcobinamide-GDP ribazoletransferase
VSVFSTLFTALAFLTRIPIPHADGTAAAIGRSASAFPLVGALLGAADICVLLILRRVMPPTLTATAIVLTGILLTGALHFDGLADTADGFGGGRTREDVLRIMRDHQIGTYGAIALIVVLLLRVTAIATLIERNAAERSLIVAPTIGRWAILLLGRWLPYARADDGLGRALTDHAGNRELCIATALALAVATIANGWIGAAGLGISVVATGLLGITARRRIGGVTGDTLGANAVVCETAVFLAGLAIASR